MRVLKEPILNYNCSCRRKHVLHLVPAIIIFIIIILASCGSKKDKKTVKIGVLFPIEGRMEKSGKDVVLGVNMAVEEINREGGAAGYKFEAIIADDKSKPAYAEMLAEKLINEEKVDFLMGVMSTEVAIKISEVSRRHKKIFIGTAHASPLLGIEHFQPYYFNARKNSFQSMAAGALFLKELRKEKPWHSIVFIGPDYAFGYETFDSFFYNLKRFKINHKLIASYWPKLYTKDYTNYIESIIRDKPDVLIFELYGGDYQEFIRQANLKNLFSRFISCNFISGGHYDNFINPSVKIPLGLFLSGANYVNWPNTELHNSFINKVKKANDKYITSSFELNHYCVQIIARAVETVGNSKDTDALVKAIEEMKIKMPSDPEGFVSYFDRNTHQIVQPVAIGKVVENKNFPPATRMLDDWKVFKAEDLLPPADYVSMRRKNALKNTIGK